MAAPLSQARKVTMVSCGGAEVGAAKLTGEVMTIVQRVPEVVRALTGIDISKVWTGSNYLPLTAAVDN